MNRSEAKLVVALRERLAIISDDASRREPDKHVAKLKSVSEKIAALSEKLPSPVDAQLAHFLARSSYEKALAFLEAKKNSPNESKARRSTAR